MANDPRYDYQIMAASKVIIRKDDSILLTKEPLENAWMPGRLGIPGGKYLLHEGIMEGTKRKILDESGMEVEIRGLFKAVQILMPAKTVYHFIFVADWVADGIASENTYSAGLQWYTKKEILALTPDELTEYYNHDLFQEYFTNPEKAVSLDFIRELRSFEDPQIQEWMNKGNKETQ